MISDLESRLTALEQALSRGPFDHTHAPDARRHHRSQALVMKERGNRVLGGWWAYTYGSQDSEIMIKRSGIDHHHLISFYVNCSRDLIGFLGGRHSVDPKTVISRIPEITLAIDRMLAELQFDLADDPDFPMQIEKCIAKSDFGVAHKRSVPPAPSPMPEPGTELYQSLEARVARLEALVGERSNPETWSNLVLFNFWRQAPGVSSTLNRQLPWWSVIRDRTWVNMVGVPCVRFFRGGSSISIVEHSIDRYELKVCELPSLYFSSMNDATAAVTRLIPLVDDVLRAVGLSVSPKTNGWQGPGLRVVHGLGVVERDDWYYALDCRDDQTYGAVTVKDRWRVSLIDGISPDGTILDCVEGESVLEFVGDLDAFKAEGLAKLHELWDGPERTR